MKYAVLGSGAMGLRFGVLLQNAGFPVDFVDTWKPQVDAVKKQGGVYVERDGKGRHLVKTNMYTPEEYHGHPDFVLVETKQMGLDDMLKRCAHFFTKDMYAATFMNGMGHVPKIDKYFPKQHVIGGTAMIGTVLNKPGDDDFIGKPGAGSCNLANQTEKPDKMTHQLVADMQKANLNPHLTTNFMGTLLAKVVFNSVVNTLCTAFQCTMGQFIKSPGAKPLSVALINEAFDVCERAGVKLVNSRQKEWDRVYTVSTTGNPKHYPSMYQDLSHNRPTEVNNINGYLYHLGLKYNYVAHTQKFAVNMVHLAETVHKLHSQDK